MVEGMQVSRTNELENGCSHYSIGRIKASSGWRAVNAPGGEADREAALRALIREAEEYGADAIIGLDFEVEGVNRVDFDGARLQRVAATGNAAWAILTAMWRKGLISNEPRNRAADYATHTSEPSPATGQQSTIQCRLRLLKSPPRRLSGNHLRSPRCGEHACIRRRRLWREPQRLARNRGGLISLMTQAVRTLGSIARQRLRQPSTARTR
jgi:hypothetical protein